MIALIAFSGEEIPELDTVRAVLAAELGDGAEIVNDPEQPSLRVSVGTETALIATRRTPISWTLLEGPCSSAWHWPEAAAVLSRHAWHIIVLLQESGGDPIHRALFLTRLAAVAGEAFGYLGVYWDSATMVHSAAEFSRAAREMTIDHLPVRLWVSFRLLPNEDGTLTLFTTGMEELGHPEIQVPRSRATAEELIQWSFLTASYLLHKGEILESGDTVGDERGRSIDVRRVPSMFDREKQVYFLDL